MDIRCRKESTCHGCHVPRVHVYNFPLLSFAVGLCISPKVVNEIRSEELTLTKGASDSLRGGLWLGLRNGDWVMGMWLMRRCHLFKTFQLTCPFMNSSQSKTTSHCNVACSECFSLEVLIFNSFKVSHS